MKFTELKCKDATLGESFSGMQEESIYAGGATLTFLPPKSRGYSAGSAWRLTDGVFESKEISQEEAEKVFAAMQDSLHKEAVTSNKTRSCLICCNYDPHTDSCDCNPATRDELIADAEVRVGV